MVTKWALTQGLVDGDDRETQKESLHVPQRLLSKTMPELCQFKCSQWNPSSEGKEYVSKPMVNQKKRSTGNRFFRATALVHRELWHFVTVCSLEGILKQQLWWHLTDCSVAGPPKLGKYCAQEPGSKSPTHQLFWWSRTAKLGLWLHSLQGWHSSLPLSRRDTLPLCLSPFTSIPYTQTTEQASVGDPCPQERHMESSFPLP